MGASVVAGGTMGVAIGTGVAGITVGAAMGTAAGASALTARGTAAGAAAPDMLLRPLTLTCSVSKLCQVLHEKTQQMATVSTTA